MSGLGIKGFLSHTENSGGGGKWLRQWRKKGVGECVVWLHTRAPIVPSFTHSFMNEDEYDDKETGRKVPTLRYPRFVSPDPEVVHKNQYFRNDDDTLQVPPDLDPFLLLREWLRFANHLGLDQPIFTFQNHKERQTINWYRGELSGLEKRGKNNFNHSLDTKLEYVYVLVDNGDIAAGPVLAREGKLLSQKIVEVIRHQQKMLGEEGGDPQQHPYAFELVAEDASSPMNAYKAYKREDAAFTDEVWAQISGEDFPDPTVYGTPADGDQEKIRDYFEAAAQVELPLDQIFSEDPAERRALTRPVGGPGGGKREPPRQSRAAAAKAAQPPPPDRPAAAATTAAAAPAPAATAKPGASAASEAAAPAAGPQPRRKKAAAVEPEPEPEPPPEPEPEWIPCDDCGHEMLATDTKCKGCGVEYEPIEDDAPPATPAPAAAAAPAAKAAAKGSKPKPVATQATASKSAAGRPAPAAETTSQAGEPQREPRCWSCGVALKGEENCPSCGIDQGDEIPFLINELESGWDLGGIGERWNVKRTNRQVI